MNLHQTQASHQSMVRCSQAIVGTLRSVIGQR
jgi:hypothetical protein